MQRAAMKRDMRLARAVAGLASDAEFAGGTLRAAGLRLDQRSWRGCVAADATFIPNLGGMRQGWIAQECLIERGPASIGGQPRERKEQLGFAETGRNPTDLHVMFAGEEAGAQFYAGRRGQERLFGGRPARAPEGIVHFDEKAFGILAEVVTRARPFQFHAIEFGDDGLRGGNLRHRAMVAIEPGLMLAGMAGGAGFGANITFATIAEGDGVRALEGDFGLEILPFAPFDRAGDGGGGEQQRYGGESRSKAEMAKDRKETAAKSDDKNEPRERH